MIYVISHTVTLSNTQHDTLIEYESGEEAAHPVNFDEEVESEEGTNNTRP